MNKLKLVLLIGSASIVTACGGNRLPESVKVTRGPASAKDAGLVVSDTTESELAAAAEQNPNIRVRVVNEAHSIYEVKGISEGELQALLPHRAETIKKNEFVRFQSADTVAELEEGDFQSLAELMASRDITQPEAEEFVRPCINNPAARPRINVASASKRDPTDASYLLTLGQSVTLDAAKTTDSTGKLPVEVLFLVFPNSDSNIPQKFTLSNSLTLKPDGLGEYTYIVVAKDKANNCAMKQDIVYVTQDTPYDKTKAISAAEAAKLDLNKFWQLDVTGAKISWPKSAGKDVVVAILDSGVNYNHPALAANIAINSKEVAGNKIDDDKNGFVDDVVGWDFGNSDAFPYDDYGHGSHCAGITASSVFGIAKNAKIMSIKIGGGAGIDTASVVGGIYYAVDNGAKIISMSLGFNQNVATLRTALEYAAKKNVIVIAAAGNGDAQGLGVDNDLVPMYPASYPLANIVSVAATGVTNDITQYSNYGLKTVHLGAPGGDDNGQILSAYKANPKNAVYKEMSGTSMATPAVAGVAAQALALKPALLPTALRKLLMDSGTASLTLKGKTASGKVVNSGLVLKALTAARPAPVKAPALRKLTNIFPRQ